jgi:hypothetical protein
LDFQDFKKIQETSRKFKGLQENSSDFEMQNPLKPLIWLQNEARQCKNLGVPEVGLCSLNRDAFPTLWDLLYLTVSI